MNAPEVVRWLREYLVAKYPLLEREFDPNLSFAALGLDSQVALEMLGELQDRLGRNISPALLYDSQSIADFVAMLSMSPDMPEEPIASATPDEPVAIVGMSCRFPGCEDGLGSFWLCLQNGHDQIRAFSELERPATDVLPHRRAGWLADIDRFDADFFAIPPREARALDPQQRMLMELSWNCFEDALIDPRKLRGRNVGVFLGISTSEYSDHQPRNADASSITGSALSIAANRLSYFYDFGGPSLAVDTACSSSLVAVHLACNAIRRGEAELALAAGANLILNEKVSHAFEAGGLLSPTGRCNTFDASADGYVRGEGAGVVLLKPLRQAIADGNKIYSVILGSAMVQDGRTNGLMAPSGRAQRKVIREACARAGLKPSQLDYVEAHGTGTNLGDLIELSSMEATVGTARGAGKCRIGSVKTNIGHLEAAAGIAGLIKTSLCMFHETLVPSINFREPNTNAGLSEMGLEVQVSLEPWRRENPDTLAGHGHAQVDSRYAGVSSFGFGGTNAHAVLTSPPRRENAKPAAFPAVLPLSAKSEESLSRLAGAYVDLLEQPEPPVFSHLIDATRRRPAAAPVRVAISFRDEEALRQELRQVEQNPHGKSSQPSIQNNGPVFVYSGQGTQWSGMGRGLFQEDPIFRNELLLVDDLVREHVRWSLVEMLFDEANAASLARTEFAQPALFAIQYALSKSLGSFNVEPVATIGHSAGEYAALVQSGIIELNEAVGLVVERASLMADRDDGAMLAISGQSEEELSTMIVEHGLPIDIACRNAPRSLVISGRRDAVKELGRVMAEQGIASLPVSEDYAFHSHLLSDQADRFAAMAKSVSPHSGNLPFYSSVTGGRLEQLQDSYWRSSIVGAVEFENAVGAALADQHTHFIEIGPKPALLAHIRKIGESQQVAAHTFATLKPGSPDTQQIATGLARLFESGVDVRWHRRFETIVNNTAIPTYPWSDMRFWQVPSLGTQLPGEGRFVRQTLQIAGTNRRVSTIRIDGNLGENLKDHVIHGRVLLPAAAVIEILLEAIETSGSKSRPQVILDEIEFHTPLELSGEGNDLQVVHEAMGDAVSLGVFARGKDETWISIATARALTTESSPRENGINPDSVKEFSYEIIEGADLYERLREVGYEYGHSFRRLDRAWLDGDCAVANVATGHAQSFICDPMSLDSSFHLAGVFASRDGSDKTMFVPTRVGQLSVQRKALGPWTVAMQLTERTSSSFTVDCELIDDKGVWARIEGLRFNPLANQPRTDTGRVDALEFYNVGWLPWVPSARLPDLAGEWIVLTNDTKLGSTIAGSLKDRGAGSTVVTPSPVFECFGDRSFGMDFGSAEDLHKLFSTVTADGKRIGGVVYCGLLDGNATATATAMPACSTGPVFLRELIHALMAVGAGGSAHVHIVTEACQPVVEKDVRNPRQAAIWGFARAVPFEHPDLRCTRIDIGDSANEREVATLCSLLGLPDNEDQFAIRGDRSFVARLLEGEIQPKQTALDQMPETDGVCLVTGATGALAIHAARAAIAAGYRNLVLLGGSKAVDLDQDAWMELGRHARMAALKCDLRDQAAVRTAIKDIEETDGRIVAIVHLAGVLDDGAIAKLTPQRITNVVTAKADGLWFILDAVGTDALKTVMLFSSAATILGSPGQASYMAANAVLDATAHFLSGRGISATSVNWGPWEGPGMASDITAREGRNSQLARSINPAQAVDLTRTLLESDEVQVAILPFDVKPLVQFYPSMRGLEFFEKIMNDDMEVLRSDGGREQLYKRPNLDTPFVAPETELERYIAGLWSRSLGMSDIGINDEFFALGGDSVFAGQIISELVATFDISLDLEQAFDTFTISSISKLIEEAIAKKADAVQVHTNSGA
ncbi:type I polyketide synthase [Parerythrobacter aestuarii]|uniref:type I polyketide synthase n=1 Tax=Parerythrobacter aestuarii TaxID=3020909 RepID=UPI0024DED814|nr:type I polyketide synthase [Parerythrobacter aestuarii]